MEKELLRKLQLEELNILKDIHSFCMDNGIRYSLYAGTAIGAIRHRGFIPWDDDIDIIMTRNNYRKFVNKWIEKPLPDLYLQCSQTEENIGITHAKIRKDGTILLSEGENKKVGHHGIWIDIFVLDKVKNTLWGSMNIKWNGLKCILLTRPNQIMTNDGFFKANVKCLISKMPALWRKKIFIKSERNIASHRKLQHGYYEIDLSALYMFKYKFPSFISKRYVPVKFEDSTFMIFKNMDLMLKIIYGDYMQLPPECEQVCKHNPIEIKFQK